MADKSARRLYSLIDGQRNIQMLAEIIQLDLPATLQLLKTLWRQHYIAFYDENTIHSRYCFFRGYQSTCPLKVKSEVLDCQDLDVQGLHLGKKLRGGGYWSVIQGMHSGDGEGHSEGRHVLVWEESART